MFVLAGALAIILKLRQWQVGITPDFKNTKRQIIYSVRGDTKEGLHVCTAGNKQKLA
jgi:hypothetical protein